MTDVPQTYDETGAVVHCQLFYVDNSQQAQVERLQSLIAEHTLPIILDIEVATEKLTQKRRQQLSQASTQPILLLDDKDKLSCPKPAVASIT